MPRVSLPNAKSNQLIIRPKGPEEEEVVRKFKAILARDRLFYRDWIMEQIKLFVQRKDPGNPQRPITVYTNPPEQEMVPNFCLKCRVFFCQQHAELHRGHLQTFKPVAPGVCAHCK